MSGSCYNSWPLQYSWVLIIFDFNSSKFRLTMVLDVSIASLYCNKATQEAFCLLFQQFFHTVHELITIMDPLVLIQSVIKTCLQHFLQYVFIHSERITETSRFDFRNIDKLPQTVPQDVINHFKAFPGLSTQIAGASFVSIHLMRVFKVCTSN